VQVTRRIEYRAAIQKGEKTLVFELEEAKNLQRGETNPMTGLQKLTFKSKLCPKKAINPDIPVTKPEICVTKCEKRV
jgi:hypothetical protein